MTVELIQSIDFADAFASPEPVRSESPEDFGRALAEARDRGDSDADRMDSADAASRQDDDSTTEETAVTDEVEAEESTTVDSQTVLTAMPVATGEPTAQAAVETSASTVATEVTAASGAVGGATSSPTASPGATETNTVSQLTTTPVDVEAEASQLPRNVAEQSGTSSVRPETATRATPKSGPEVVADSATVAQHTSRVSASPAHAANEAQPQVAQYFASTNSHGASGGAATSRPGVVSVETPGFHLLDGEQAVTPSAPADGGASSALRRETGAPGTFVPEAAAPASSSTAASEVAAAVDAAAARASSGASPSVTPQVASVDAAVPGAEVGPRGMTAPATEATVRVGPEIDQAVARKIQRALRGALRRGENHLRIRLDPPELGRIDIQIKMSSDRLGVHMDVDNAEIRNAITKHIDELERLLDTYGREGGEVSVDVREDRDSQRGDGSNQQQGASSDFVDGNDLTDAESTSWITDRHLGQRLDLVQ